MVLGTRDMKGCLRMSKTVVGWGSSQNAPGNSSLMVLRCGGWVGGTSQDGPGHEGLSPIWSTHAVLYKKAIQCA